MSDGTFGRLTAVMVTVLLIPRASIEPRLCLSDVAPIDSLTLAELASAIDDEFGIQLPGDDLSTALTVERLVDLIDACVDRGNTLAQ